LGIIRRQSIQSSLLQYIGAAIGFVNKILLFTNFLTTEEVGLANILVTNAMLYAQFSAMGFTTMTLRFFPYFQDKQRKHHNFLLMLLVIPAIGFVVVTLLILIFQHHIFHWFQKESPLMIEYFWYLIPLAFATLYFDLFDAYLRSLLKTVVPILFREIIQRVFIAIAILFYAVGWVTFPEFVVIYVALLSSVTLLMVLYTWWLGHLHLRASATWRMRKLLRKVLVFGGYTLMGNISAIILYNIDGLMLASYTGMREVGIYTTSYYVSALITIPWRAIQKVASPQIAEHWAKNDLPAMQKLYQRTSLINLGIGIYLFVMMYLGIDSLFAMMPTAFATGASVLIIIGVSRVLDMITGLNTYILIMSRYFRIDLYLSLFVFVAGIAMNFYFIPNYGIVGASFATGLAILLANLGRLGFLWVKYGLHPFNSKMLVVLAVGVVTFGLTYLLPPLHNVFMTYALHGIVFTALFGSLILWLNAIPDSRKMLKLLVDKARPILGKMGLSIGQKGGGSGPGSKAKKPQAPQGRKKPKRGKGR
jgi:O-antigen/teichoic acid export membrane protein